MPAVNATIGRRELLARAALLGFSLPAIEAALASPARAESAAVAKRGGTLRFARNFEPQSLDPFGPADNGSIFARVQIWDTLVEARPGVAHPTRPASARSRPSGASCPRRSRSRRAAASARAVRSPSRAAQSSTRRLSNSAAATSSPVTSGRSRPRAPNSPCM
jgi:hypothetical protein